MEFNGFDFEFLLGLHVWQLLGWVIMVIVVDAILGIARALKEGTFQLREVPRFLGTNVLPYCLGLLVLAVVAKYWGGEILHHTFNVVSVFVFARYIAKWHEKIKDIFYRA